VRTTHNRRLEAQIAPKASFSSTPPDRLPIKPEPKSREQCNAMILRGGKQLEGPKEITNDESLHDKNDHDENIEKEISTPSKEVINYVIHKSDEVPQDPKTIFLMPNTPYLPFAQRMAKAKLDSQLGKFLEVINKVYITYSVY